MKPTSKIVQILLSQQTPTLYLLCQDGSVWLNAIGTDVFEQIIEAPLVPLPGSYDMSELTDEEIELLAKHK